MFHKRPKSVKLAQNRFRKFDRSKLALELGKNKGGKLLDCSKNNKQIFFHAKESK